MKKEKKPLFDKELIEKLETLSLLSKKLRKGAMRGEHRVLRKGMSTEFHDYREYNSGDDLRYMDWNIYGRLNKLLIKVFSGEEDQSVHILLDTSLSMNSGIPLKIDFAKKIAGALAYISVHNLDRVGITCFANKMLENYIPQRRLSSMFALFNHLESIESQDQTDFNRSLIEYSVSVKRPGKAVIISDMMDPKGFEEGLLALKYRKFDLIVIHVISESELNPPYKGSYKFEDSETGKKLKISLDNKYSRAYREEISKWFTSLETFCRSKGIDYIRSRSSVSMEDFLMNFMRRGGILS